MLGLFLFPNHGAAAADKGYPAGGTGSVSNIFLVAKYIV